MDKIKELIEKEYSNITGIIVKKESENIYENFFSGCNCNTPVNIASVTKSLLSLITGIAIDKGYILSEEQKILDFFPDYQLKRGEKRLPEVTIKNLLTMTTPLKYRSEPYTKVYSSNHWTKEVLDLLGGRNRDKDFKYTTVGLHVLSSILTKATNKSLLEFVTENIFIPLDIIPPTGKELNTKEDHLEFIKNCKTKSWIVDPEGVYTAGWGLALSTKDLLKIGTIYINKGNYSGNQIVSKEWINKSTTVKSIINNHQYGYLWWIIDEEKRIYAAIGDGGNIIYISEKNNLVVAITSSFMLKAKDRVVFIQEHVLPLL